MLIITILWNYSYFFAFDSFRRIYVWFTTVQTCNIHKIIRQHNQTENHYLTMIFFVSTPIIISLLSLLEQARVFHYCLLRTKISFLFSDKLSICPFLRCLSCHVEIWSNVYKVFFGLWFHINFTFVFDVFVIKGTSNLF